MPTDIFKETWATYHVTQEESSSPVLNLLYLLMSLGRADFFTKTLSKILI